MNKAYLPVAGAGSRPATLADNPTVKPGDRVFLVNCHDRVTGESFFDIWIANKNKLSWADFIKKLNPLEQGLEFEFMGEREILIDNDSQLYVDIGVKVFSAPMVSALNAVASMKKKSEES